MSTEAILQQTVVAMIRVMYPDLVINLSLNGISLEGLTPKQKSQIIAQAKREGMEPGIQDLSIYLPKAQVLNLEFKRPKGGVQSPDQKKTQAKLTAIGHNYHLVRSVEDVFQLIAGLISQDFRISQFDKLKQMSNLPFDVTYLKSFYYFKD